MHLIDRFAYNNNLRLVDPAHKAAIAFLTVLLCLVLNKTLVGVIALAWMVYLTVTLAGISGRSFGRILTAELTFLLLTTIGVAVSVSTQPSDALWSQSVGPLWFAASAESLQQALLLVTRAIGCAAALNFLALTTPLVDIIALLRRWRVPDFLIDLMTIMYRFIFVLLDTLERMMTAQSSRLGYHVGYRRGMQNAGEVGSRLFIVTLRHSQRLERGLTARGYDGSLRVLPPQHTSMPSFGRIISLITATLVIAWFISP